jgi:UPF0755 protein
MKISSVRIGIVLLLLLSLIAVGLLGAAQRYLDTPVSLASTELDAEGRLYWTIAKGSNLHQVSRSLEKQQIITQPRLLTGFARLSGRSAIQAGSYWINPGDSPRSLLNKFNSGDVIRYQITFPEGWSFAQWIAHLASKPQFAAVADLSVAALLAGAEIDLEHPEGWFFPETYSYSGTDSVSDILAQAHKRMQQVLAEEWQGRESNLPYKSAYEALIMASIIEKETGLAEERGAVAGVFVRRLRANMRLQTDPTVIYGMGDRFKGNIRRRDLKQMTAYNTYRIKGLPPTPIAMPSAAAIHAALHPEPGSSLYFVARGDGGHYFSDSLEEHLKAVQQYQVKGRVQNYQSAPQ